jgi:hypothetical protein
MACSRANFTFYIIYENYKKELSKKGGKTKRNMEGKLNRNRKKVNIMKV